jgi:hypothetical protein
MTMRSIVGVAGLAFGLTAMLAGCDDVDRATNHAEHAANSVADAADRMADSVDRMDNLSERTDAAVSRAERMADRAANIAVPVGSSLVTDDWVGRWRGVEGLNLVIAKDRGKGPGHYTLTMQYSLDDKGEFRGTADGEAIRFTRPDGEQELHAVHGDETGLKYLAGKQECLMVKPGEGYCRG